MKIFVLKKEKILAVAYFVIIILGLVFTMNEQFIATSSMPMSKKVVLIDAGHGGADPGAVSGNVFEKNINLKIAQRLQAYLEQGDTYVIMTRLDDSALSSSKQTDMYRRKLLANSSEADIFVSIHQNMFSSSAAKGAQVFYFGKSPNSKYLAECIQSEIKRVASVSNKKKPEPNMSYYVLRQTVMPSVIVECGFMSNPGERWKLTTEDYQDRMAWAIYLGIVKYFNEEADI